MINDLRQRLAQLDSCVVSDALDKLGISGVAAGIARLSTDKKLAGRVLTVKLDTANGRMADRHLCTAAIEAATPGDIIVVEHHSRADCAGWGGLLSRAALVQKVQGVIVDGLCRDIVRLPPKDGRPLADSLAVLIRGFDELETRLRQVQARSTGRGDAVPVRAARAYGRPPGS